MATIDRYVSETAGVNARRSMMPMNRRVLTSYFHGYLQPIGVPIEVLPGDTWKAKCATLIRMSTPLRPLMDNIRFELDCFFVPKRVVWHKTKLFYGEAETFGIAEKVDEPYSTGLLVDRDSLDTNLKASENLLQAFGLVNEDLGNQDLPPINVLPIRSFLACYNEFYRDQNYQDPFKWDTDETGEVSALAYLGLNEIDETSLLPKVNKDKDLFISILPWAQKGDPVTLSFGGYAPVQLSHKRSDIENGQLTLYAETASEVDEDLPLISKFDGDNSFLSNSTYDDKIVIDPNGTLEADIRNVSVNINSLLYALAYQDFLVKAAHYGTKYKEYIYSMFGTTIADATEDIPEYLGRMKMNININQVTSTIDQGAGLGDLGAYSVTGDNKDLFTSSFTEPGYLVFIGYCKHQRTYSSGIDKVFLKHELLDYYQPPFANIGDVPISSIEIFAGGQPTELGYQEPWYEYRSLQDRVYGILNPLMPQSLANWTLAERFDEQPTINSDFLVEDRTAFIDALASGENGPDYIMDFEFRFEVTRVMPLFSSNKLGSM